eukprot:7918589-Prorocentrum_lima.AAC.1
MPSPPQTTMSHPSGTYAVGSETIVGQNSPKARHSPRVPYEQGCPKSSASATAFFSSSCLFEFF